MDRSLNLGMCRCCASEGTFKDLRSKYHWMGEEEVYADMIKECFDINMSNETDINGICQVCITQLRNASNFKKQVQRTEEELIKHIEEKNIKKIEAPFVKVELQQDPSDDSDDDVYREECTTTEFKVPIKDELLVEVKPRKRSTRSTSSSSPTKKKAKKEKGETSSKRTHGGTRKRKKTKVTHYSATPERTEHRVNLTTILQFSNASPFRDKTMRGFSCLYCSKYFKNIEDLRAHTSQQTEKDKMFTMIDYKLSYNPIKIDITNLLCKVCHANMKDLTELKDHLVSIHKKRIFKDIKDIILPFRLENGQNFECVVCSVKYASFKNLYHHMSSHYRNYCCNTCGAGFITIAALRKHFKTHEQGSFPCKYCDKVYSSLSKQKNHEKGVHTGGWLRNKCPHCPQVFVSYYDRSEHLVQEHNEEPLLFPCNACEKTYKKKFELNRHIKHHHLQQKNYMCDICNAKFFSKRGLVDHMSRHGGGEVHTCDICARTFSRARTLKEHMRNHDDDKRFQCEVCKKTFMQKCSLKSHMRLHQDDLDIFKEFDDVKHLVDDRSLTLKQIAAESKEKEELEKMKEQIENDLE